MVSTQIYFMFNQSDQSCVTLKKKSLLFMHYLLSGIRRLLGKTSHCNVVESNTQQKLTKEVTLRYIHCTTFSDLGIYAGMLKLILKLKTITCK